jgi:20S proteasome alpha/beta subunit
MIATTLNYSIPFVVADVLFSSEEGTEGIRLPTNDFPILPFLKDVTYKPVFLKQKLYILQPNVCLAIAGNYNELVPFVTELRTQCKYYSNFGTRKVTKEQIMEFLSEQNLDITLKESGFLISHVGYDENDQPETWNQFTRGDWGEIDDDVFEGALAFGSGKKDFFNHIKQPVSVTSSHENGNIHRAMQMNTTFISKLLSIERVTLSNLQNAWGAGYEIAYFNGTTFKKIEDNAYVICHGDFDAIGEIGIPVPRLILYYNYVNDNLIITAVELYEITKTEEGQQIVFRSNFPDFFVNVYIVPSIEHKDSDPPIEVPDNFSFLTSAISFGYAITTPSNGMFNPAFYTVSKDVNVEFVQNKFVEIRLHSDLNDMVRAGAKNAFLNILKESPSSNSV